jgi:hypothetical protein
MGVIFSRTGTVMDKGIIHPGAGDVAPEDERTKKNAGITAPLPVPAAR